MAAVTVSADDGLCNIPARVVTTVQQVNLPIWTRRVGLQVRAGGADVEVGWTGVLDAASFATATLWVVCPAGSSITLDVPPKFNAASPPVLWIRDQAATATTIDIVCQPRAAS